MHLVCLTPTYGRPSLVRNALALFLRQQLRDGDTAHIDRAIFRLETIADIAAFPWVLFHDIWGELGPA